ncbi:tyrosine-type recombinase/integrase [Cuspidothrix issatschenkoi LEGE 03284]|jgi:integrase/recombinase XerD|uniref:tyrosine-type recombinase/integrase n=1 Tax=Cuspidothrix issatschenkoi TaxID=230752 RepID=UPI0018815D87|nr:tyrosine-type recombinase/integrase [Cuspidothrix issatschenkoi]MBE9233766.1 tyrosine-type recombinase/integrase [Cuspidothrix issatschenkoi LEGE 03284]
MTLTALQSTTSVIHYSDKPIEVILNMWLHGKAINTQQSYKRISNEFLTFIGKPLVNAGLDDVQNFLDSLELSPNTVKTYASIIKSLISFCHELGIMKYNVAKPVKTPKPKDCLTERIMSEQEITLLIHGENNTRNKLILKMLYYCGLRATELAGLTWGDLSDRTGNGQATIYGKGSKTRVVIIPTALWRELEQLRGDAGKADPVFRSRQGNGFMTRATVWNVVKSAAKRIGLDNPSPHWLRHGHASHSLDRGAPIHLVSQSLGHASVATTSRYLHAKPSDCSSLYLG